MGSSGGRERVPETALSNIRLVQGSRPPTIRDVAAAAGVSITTVSRVVRDHQDVHPATRGRVLQVIQDLGYRPSSLARALVSGYARTIGLLVSDIANPFYPQLAKSIEDEARGADYALVICNTEDEPSESLRYVRRLLDHGTAGLIHASAGLDEEIVLAAVGDPRRIVFVNRRPTSSAASYVVSDNVNGGRLLAEHLVSLGHRRIGFIAGPPWAANSRERLTGIRAVARDAGADVLVAEGDFTPSSGVAAVESWLRESRPPTAIVGVSDQVALGAVAALAQSGIDVPTQMAVAGFDDIEFAASQIIGLTSVAQHIDEMGRRSVRILLRQLGTHGTRVQRIELAPNLVVRRTTQGTSRPRTVRPRRLGGPKLVVTEPAQGRS